MSDAPPTGSSSGLGPTGLPPPPGPPSVSTPWLSAPPPTPRRPSRWPTFVAVAIALVAVGLAVVGWFRPPLPPPPPPPPAPPTFTDQQISDAKVCACNAFEIVQKGVRFQTNEDPSSDASMRKAQAANAQLSVVAGGWYLRDNLDPATPPPLAAAIQHLAPGPVGPGCKLLSRYH